MLRWQVPFYFKLHEQQTIFSDTVCQCTHRSTILTCSIIETDMRWCMQIKTHMPHFIYHPLQCFFCQQCCSHTKMLSTVQMRILGLIPNFLRRLRKKMHWFAFFRPCKLLWCGHQGAWSCWPAPSMVTRTFVLSPEIHHQLLLMLSERWSSWQQRIKARTSSLWAVSLCYILMKTTGTHRRWNIIIVQLCCCLIRRYTKRKMNVRVFQKQQRFCIPSAWPDDLFSKEF